MPGTRTTSRDNLGHIQAAIRDLAIQHNNLVLDMEVQRILESCDVVSCWLSAGNTAFSANPIGRGTTDTNVATGSVNFSIGGVPVNKAAVAAGTALGALGSIPQNTWGVISIEVIAAGTISYQSGAANYTTGYASEALALAALPAPVTAKARLGAITILAPAASAFVCGTNSLAGGGTTPAQTTNYYATFGAMAPTGNRNFVGGANGVLIGNVGLAKGSTDTNLANLAFTYNANGISNMNKAAVAAGTAFGALGTVPVGKWAIIVAYVDAAQVVTFQSGPANYTTGYATEAQAKADLPFVTVPAGKCRMGYITLQTKDAATTWIAGTDALAGGATGNPASATNYFSQPGQFGGLGSQQPFQSGMLAAQIGTTGSPVTADLTENAIAFLPNTGL